MNRVNIDRKSEKEPQKYKELLGKNIPMLLCPDLMAGTGWRLRHLYWDWLISSSCCPELVRLPCASSMYVLSANREVI